MIVNKPFMSVYIYIYTVNIFSIESSLKQNKKRTENISSSQLLKKQKTKKNTDFFPKQIFFPSYLIKPFIDSMFDDIFVYFDCIRRITFIFLILPNKYISSELDAAVSTKPKQTQFFFLFKKSTTTFI